MAFVPFLAMSASKSVGWSKYGPLPSNQVHNSIDLAIHYSNKLIFFNKNAVKMAGFVVLLGVGGVVCYKLYSAHRNRIVSAIRAAFLYPIHFEMERRMAADHDHQEIMDDGEEVRNTHTPE